MKSSNTLPDRPPVSIETMLNGISSQSELIHGVINHVTPQLDVLSSQLSDRKIDNIYITGCGDSYFAALATRLAFEKYSGCRIEAIEALEFSRYSVDYLPAKSLVISISSGGDKSRPVEALREAQQKGAFTIAISGTTGSPITQYADFTILQNERNYRAVPPKN